MSKNNNNEHESTWQKAVHWITSNGGYIHPQLSYNESERQVYLNHNIDNSSITIDAGTTLLQVPDICLPSLHSVECDEEFGKSLFGVVHGLVEGSLYHDAQDVVLALYLARQYQLLQRSFYDPYLRTLPINNTNVSSDNDELLPRQWDDDTLKRRLDGSSLYSRIVDERNGILAEYEVVKTAWEQQQKEQDNNDDIDTATFPTFEQYDKLMSQVTSRGFDGLGYDGVDVMIPLLDLLNHSRGRGQSNDEDVGNVRYERYCVDEGQQDGDAKEEVDDEPASKRVKTSVDNDTGNGNATGNGCGGVRVTAKQAISAKRTKLQMTYGAKSNSTLLGRYGFCIADNVEPDGSNNDVVEIELKEGSPPVKLQRGPKSYTYGPFIKALELFHDISNVGRGVDNDDAENCLQEENIDEGKDFDDDGGFEAFLNDCEEDEIDHEEEEDDEDGDDFDDMMYDSKSCGVDDKFNNTLSSIKSEGKTNEIRALVCLQSSLNQAIERCERNSLICGEEGKPRLLVEDSYCVILIKSEIRTLHFYKRAAAIIHSKLSESSPQDASILGGQFDDQEQVRALVDAFMTIRYPDLSI